MTVYEHITWSRLVRRLVRVTEIPFPLAFLVKPRLVSIMRKIQHVVQHTGFTRNKKKKCKVRTSHFGTFITASDDVD